MLLTHFEQSLLNDYQRDFPLTSEPFTAIANRLGVSEQQVLDGFERLQSRGLISRIGPVLTPKRIGASTLAALAVPSERLDAVAEIVNQYEEVNHNYEREHYFNLWFVVTAADQARLVWVLEDIERRTGGLAPLSLPLLESYHIDLAFELR